MEAQPPHPKLNTMKLTAQHFITEVVTVINLVADKCTIDAYRVVALEEALIAAWNSHRARHVVLITQVKTVHFTITLPAGGNALEDGRALKFVLSAGFIHCK